MAEHVPASLVIALGQRTVQSVRETGYLAALFIEALYWLALGRWRRQPVRLSAIVRESMHVGVSAIPIVALASFATGMMLAIQGIYTLRSFGAESQVVMGIALSVTREFAPLITGIFVAGRSGSAIAARIGTMQISQEIDALRVIGINPVRYLVSPLLAAMLLTLPALTVLATVLGLGGGALYCAWGLSLPPEVFFDRSFDVLTTTDLTHGLLKSTVFAVIVTLIGAGNGFNVKAGAEGVGRATTRAVVLGCIGIILADMVFTFLTSR
ncbi:MAG: ABC transporter permease [Rhodocyclaceae bacterium]|nr:ABC transporter permease [Rhodocyclaceae bacterium]MCL4757613.1 ABC transporter permease [Rhodocyclaceae bacterium]